MTALTPDAVVDKFQELGCTWGEVKRSLIKLGIKGKKRDSEHCPLANWIKQAFPGVTNVKMGQEIVVGDIKLKPCIAVWEFWNAFDCGLIPELEETSHANVGSDSA